MANLASGQRFSLRGRKARALLNTTVNHRRDFTSGGFRMRLSSAALAWDGICVAKVASVCKQSC